MATLSSSLSSAEAQALVDGFHAEAEAAERSRALMVMELAGAGWVRADLPGAEDLWRGHRGTMLLNALWDRLDWEAKPMVDSKGRLFLFVGRHAHIAPTQEMAARVLRMHS